ncbi:hypothetical protein [Undibacterium terreum]|uniref:Uncharacterized protein n=1 Tax=Undibacterium terreum TaxID=1224302 RepID=A0A916V0I4_9BURK|nr:hypothetical protein [Undibacterium terreum]GGC98710.1 hypothetical protein GCM10011396_52810 [Undibacterium terreum]
MPGSPTSVQTRQLPRNPQSNSPSLYYAGGNVGLGYPLASCYFAVVSNDTEQHWSVAKTVRHFLEFSREAKARILADCTLQQRYSQDADTERHALAHTLSTLTGGHHA